VESRWKDVSYSVRTLVRTPTFTAAAVLSVALGVGGNLAVFTVLNRLFLIPLPVDQPARLVDGHTLDTKNTTQFGNIMPLSYPNMVDLRDGTRAFSGLAGYSAPILLAMSSGGETEMVFSQLATGNYFDVLGVRPAAGRCFLPEEDLTPGTPAVVVLNPRFWHSRLGGRGQKARRAIPPAPD